MPADAIAVYTIVMMLQYDRGAPVRYVGREREIAIRSGMSAGRLAKAVAELVDLGKLHVADGCLTNHRVEREIAKISQKIAKNRENSAKGGESTRKKFPTKASKNKGADKPSGQPTGQPKEGPISPFPLPEEEEPSSLRSDGSAGEETSSKTKSAKRSVIAEDAQPDEVDRKTATEAGMDAPTFRHEWAVFRDHHRGAGSLMLDWNAVWRKWVRKWTQFSARDAHVNGARAGPAKAMSMTAATLDFMAELHDKHN